LRDPPHNSPAIHRSIHARVSIAGFTLVELLVCLAIVAVLTAIILPALARARESAREVVCQSNLHHLMQGFIAFSEDHDDQLPGGYWDLRYQTDPNPEHWDWLRGNWSQWTTAPAGGTLFRYINRQPGIYRCPSLDNAGPAATAVIGPGAQSNGQYDYVSMLDFTGARITNVKLTSQLNLPGGAASFLATPVIVEGDPALLNGFQLKSWHAGSDAIAHTHRGGGFYASIDASVHWINEPPGGCANWQSQCPSKAWANLSPYPFYWGQWNRQ
jgi:prepilin-type N-terminal cleavage/methylation domain-containing protein